MRDIRSAQQPHDQSCPVCGAQLAPGSLYCEACGTDLSRSGVLFSTTEIRPATLPPQHRKVPKQFKSVAGVALGILALASLGGVPAVSAHVPMLGTIYAQTVGRVFGGRSTPPPATGQRDLISSFLLVRSEPAGSQVQIDDQQVGTTPMSIDLKPGTYHVIVSHDGYPTITRTVEVTEGPAVLEVSLLTGQVEAPQVPQPQAAPAPAPARPAAPRLPPPQPPPQPPKPPLAAGTRAPTLALKDRLGVIHGLNPGHGQKTAILFIWSLDDQAQQVIRDLDQRVRKSGGRLGSLVVLMQNNRVSVRTFLTAWQVKVPLLFGTPQVAAQYHVTSGVNMLYLVSERGTIERVQSGTIQPSAILH